jgi:hypothetical protein
VKSRRRAQLISLTVAVVIFVFGGPRQESQATAKPKVEIGTACVMVHTATGTSQTCR